MAAMRDLADVAPSKSNGRYRSDTIAAKASRGKADVLGDFEIFVFTAVMAGQIETDSAV